MFITKECTVKNIDTRKHVYRHIKKGRIAKKVQKYCEYTGNYDTYICNDEEVPLFIIEESGDWEMVIIRNDV